MLLRARAIAATAILPVLLLGGLLAACTPAQTAVDHAREQIGTPYRYGGSTPSTGFDCSGLTSWSWKQAGVTTMPRTSRDQWRWVDRIQRSQLQPGDLVFYSANGPSGTVSHVALYSGDGKIIHAPSSGKTVTETTVDYWKGALVGFGRVPAEALP